MNVKKQLACALAGVVAMAAGSARAADDGVKTLVAGNNAFAVDLFQRLNQDAQASNAGARNLFFSPFSISTALSMVEVGARNKTLEQMNAVLHFDQMQLQAGLPGLLAGVNGAEGEKRAYELAAANALWVEQTFALEPAYVRALKNGFKTDGAYAADFVKDAEGMRKKINTWVEDQTHQKIKDLLPQGSVTGSTALVLANAVYFKGTWETPFAKVATTEQEFQIGNGKTVTVPLMRSGNEGSYAYMENEAFQAVSLPYKGAAGETGRAAPAEMSMVVILPRQVERLAEVEKTVSVENLGKWEGAMKRQPVRVFLPRFTMTWSAELSQPLARLGMKDAFTGAADFSGISATSQGKLFISGVYHKAFVDVNEEGTEAAAATGVTMSRTAVMRDPAVFRADHPFLFLIRHEATGEILFMGHVVNPGG